MKRAVILLILLFTLSLAGCVCAAALVNSAQDKAHFEPETLVGDPALCEGVSVRANTDDVAEFSNQLYFELGFDAASGETDCTFSLNEPTRTGSGYSPSYTDRLAPIIQSRLYPEGYASAAEVVLPPHMQYVADKTRRAASTRRRCTLRTSTTPGPTTAPPPRTTPRTGPRR